jgi:hypothetical protein
MHLEIMYMLFCLVQKISAICGLQYRGIYVHFIKLDSEILGTLYTVHKFYIFGNVKFAVHAHCFNTWATKGMNYITEFWHINICDQRV